jgi:hypothetical protein
LTDSQFQDNQPNSFNLSNTITPDLAKQYHDTNHVVADQGFHKIETAFLLRLMGDLFIRALQRHIPPNSNGQESIFINWKQFC